MVLTHLSQALTYSLRYGVRVFWRCPGFSFFVILTVGFGIGVNTAVFTVVNAVLLKALPVTDPGSLYFIGISGASGRGTGVPYPFFSQLQGSESSLTDVVVFQPRDFHVTIGGQSESLNGQLASRRFFEVLGISAIVGRVFDKRDDVAVDPGRTPAIPAVISYNYWDRRFGRSLDAIGTSVQVGEITATIIGVTPPQFFGLQTGRLADITFPLALASPAALRNETSTWLTAVGRVRNNSIGLARSQLDTELGRYVLNHKGFSHVRITKISLDPASHGLSSLRRQFSQSLWALLGLVLLILLAASVNLTTLFLGRASSRSAEFRTRRALGAGSQWLVLQLTIENALLVTSGLVFGLFAGKVAASLLVGMIMSGDDRFVLALPLDPRVLGFAFLIALITCVLTGLLPAIGIVRQTNGLASGSRTVLSTGSAISRSLVVCQVAVSLLLVTTATLLVRSFQNLTHSELGFYPSGVLTVRLEANRSSYSSRKMPQVWNSVLTAVRTIPGISAASFSALTPLSTLNAGVVVSVPGVKSFSESEREVMRNDITPEYFRLMRIPLIAGRGLLDTDTAASHNVIVIDEAAARFFFATAENAVGRQVQLGNASSSSRREIVGVVANAKQRSVRELPQRLIYFPLEQSLDDFSALTLSLMCRGEPMSYTPHIIAQIRRVAPELLSGHISTLRRQVDDSLRQERTLAALSGTFGVLALLLAAIGIYGVIMQAVTNGTREIGLRMAVGATRTNIVVGLVVKRILPLTVVGVFLGLGACVTVTTLVRSQLYGLDPADINAVVVSVTILLFVVCLASAQPLRRAALVDPAIALRE
jgi:predicted permease